jgi:hypothetical protein
MFRMTLAIVMATPVRRVVWTSPAARRAPLIMKNVSMPMLDTNIVRMYGSASR